MLYYRAALPLSHQALTFTAGIIRRHRWAIGSGWRKLNPGQQALLVLAYPRKGETFAEVAAGFGIGTGENPLPRQEQTGIAEGSQPGPRELRAPGERANAQLKAWRILRKLRCCPWRAGQLAKAIHVLQLREA